MFEKLKMLSARLDELEMRLSAPDLYDDPARAARLLRERNELEPIVEAYRAYERAQQQLADATEMLSDPDMKELAQEELQQAKSDIARLEGELKLLLLPKDPNDEKNIYVEIRGGAGGGTTREVCLSKKLCFLTNERFRSIRSGPLILCAKGIRNWYDSFGTSRYSDAKKISFLPRSRLFLKLLSHLFFSFEKMVRIYLGKAFVFVRFAKISFWLFCRLTGRPRNMYNRCYEIRVSLPIFE